MKRLFIIIVMIITGMQVYGQDYPFNRNIDAKNNQLKNVGKESVDTLQANRLGQLQIISPVHFYNKTTIDSAVYGTIDTTQLNSAPLGILKSGAAGQVIITNALGVPTYVDSLSLFKAIQSYSARKLPDGVTLKQNPDSTLSVDSTKMATFYELKKDTTALRTFSDSKYTKYSDSTVKFITPTQVNGLDIYNWTNYGTYIKYSKNLEADTLFGQDTAFHPLDNSIAPSKITNSTAGNINVYNGSGVLSSVPVSGDFGIATNGNTIITNHSVAPFPRRNFIVYPESGTTITWNASTNTLSWNGNIYCVSPNQAAYTIATGSINTLTSADLVVLSASDTGFVAINEDLKSVSQGGAGNQTGYLIDYGGLTGKNLSVNGMISIGLRRGNNFYFFYPSLNRVLLSYVDSNAIATNSVTLSKINSASMTGAVTSTWIADNTVQSTDMANASIKNSLPRNTNIYADNNNGIRMNIIWNYATKTLSWNKYMYLQESVTGSYMQIAPGSLVGIDSNDVVVLSSTNGSYTAINENTNGGTAYLYKVPLLTSLMSQGMIVFGKRIRDSFFLNFNSLLPYFNSQFDSTAFSNNSISYYNLSTQIQTMLNSADTAVMSSTNYAKPLNYDSTITYGLVTIGQSNSLGGASSIEAAALISSDVPLPRYNNLKIQKTGSSPDTYGVFPLTQMLASISGDVRSISPSVYMADGITNFYKMRGKVNNYKSISMSTGTGGEPYSYLKKNGTGNNYALSLEAIEASKIYCQDTLHTNYQVAALFNIHGESDAQINNTNYASNLKEWVDDYNLDIDTITHQTKIIRMFISQISWGAPTVSSDFNMTIKNAQISAQNDSIVLVTPTYMLDITAPDTVNGDYAHFNAEGTRRLGEYFAKVYEQTEDENVQWHPLEPLSQTRVDSIIKVKFYVPVTPLNWDTSLICINNNRGFEFKNSSDTTITISSVLITGVDEVTIILNKTPTAGTNTLYYAYTDRFMGSDGKSYHRARGQLRDNDQTKSLWGYNLNNYCVSFSVKIN